MGSGTCFAKSHYLVLPINPFEDFVEIREIVQFGTCRCPGHHSKRRVLSPSSKAHTKRKRKERLVLGCQSFGNNVLPLFPGLHSEDHRLSATRQIKNPLEWWNGKLNSPRQRTAAGKASETRSYPHQTKQDIHISALLRTRRIRDKKT